jgi:hypothetical protein
VVDGLGDPHVCADGSVFPIVQEAHYVCGMFLDNVVYFGVVHCVHVLNVVCHGCDHGVDGVHHGVGDHDDGVHYDVGDLDGVLFGRIHCGVGDHDVDGVHYGVGNHDVGVHYGFAPGIEILGCTNDGVPDDEVHGDYDVLFDCGGVVHGSVVVQAYYVVHGDNVVDDV